LRRYCRALDSADLSRAFLELWGLLETLTGISPQEGHDSVVKRVSFIFADTQRKTHEQILHSPGPVPVTTKARAPAIGPAVQALGTRRPSNTPHAAGWLQPVVSPLDAPLFLERILIEFATFTCSCCT
jgi:hypothetical protein